MILALEAADNTSHSINSSISLETNLLDFSFIVTADINSFYILFANANLHV